MKRCPENWNEFKAIVNHVKKNFQFIQNIHLEIDDCEVPWINVLGKGNITYEDSLIFMEELQLNFTEKVLFASLVEDKLSILITENLSDPLEYFYDDDLDGLSTCVLEFGCTIEEMKEKFNLK